MTHLHKLGELGAFHTRLTVATQNLLGNAFEDRIVEPEMRAHDGACAMSRDTFPVSRLVVEARARHAAYGEHPDRVEVRIGTNDPHALGEPNVHRGYGAPRKLLLPVTPLEPPNCLDFIEVRIHMCHHVADRNWNGVVLHRTVFRNLRLLPRCLGFSEEVISSISKDPLYSIIA